MEKYQFKIEDVIVVNPEGWKDFTLTLSRDKEIAGLLTTSTNEFVFKGDGYDALKARFDVNYNDKVNVTIDILQTDQTYQEQYIGVIKLSNTTFNLEKRTAEAVVIDANFQGAISGNKSVKSFLNAGITKNGETTAVPTIYTLDYFNAAGTYQTLLNRNAYLLKDALDFLVRFMTDDAVKGVQSAYLDDISNWGDALPYITTGISIRLASQDAPNVSFAECMVFLQRTHDLTFDFVTDSSGDPVMRIEERGFFFNATNQDTIRSITDLKVKVDTQKIASHIEVGNNTVNDAGNCSSTTRWFTFQKEDYALKGKGNVDKLIDLTIDFVTDSNAITAIVGGSTSFDDDIFIVLGNIAGTQAEKYASASYCSGLNIYNEGFTNDNVIDRMLEAVPNSVTKYLTAATTPARADKGVIFTEDFGATPAQTTITVPREFIIRLTQEKYDLGNNYNDILPVTYYDVPFAGNFSFEASLKTTFVLDTLHQSTGFTDANLDYQISIDRFDSSFTTPPKEQVLSPVTSFNLGGTDVEKKFVNKIHNLQTTMNCATGDRIVVRILVKLRPSTNVSRVTYNVIPDFTFTYFKCLGAETDAGVFKVFDPNSFKARNYTFEKNVSLTRSDAIRANARNSIVINELSDTNLDKTTWIEEMVNNIETGATSFTMIN